MPVSNSRTFTERLRRLCLAGGIMGVGLCPKTSRRRARCTTISNCGTGRHARAHPPALYVAVRDQEGREANPTVAINNSQTAKGAQEGGLGSILPATGRKIKGRKGHILVDTLGSC